MSPPGAGPALAVLAALAAALAVALALPPPPRPSLTRRDPETRGHDAPDASAGWMVRHRVWWSLLAGLAAATFVGGPVGAVGGLVAGVGTWVVIGRAEPAHVRRRRETLRHELPLVVTLLAAALRSGAAAGEAAGVVAAALPGPAGDRLAAVSARLAVGVDPVRAWESLGGEDPELAPLGRTLARALRTGAPVVASVERLATELSRSARADVEDRARAVGVKAALPLGLCLLPAFLLLGIVPLVAGLAGSLGI